MTILDIMAALGALAGLLVGGAVGFHLCGLLGAFLAVPVGAYLGMFAGGLACVLLWIPFLVAFQLQDRQQLQLCIAARYDPRPRRRLKGK